MRVNTSVRAAMVLLLLVVGSLLSMPAMAEEAATAPAIQPSTPAQLTPVQPAKPLFMVTYACCLDEWQPGNCPAGTRRFAWCNSTCETCGSFTCVSLPNTCFR